MCGWLEVVRYAGRIELRQRAPWRSMVFFALLLPPAFLLGMIFLNAPSEFITLSGVFFPLLSAFVICLAVYWHRQLAVVIYDQSTKTLLLPHLQNRRLPVDQKDRLRIGSGIAGAGGDGSYPASTLEFHDPSAPSPDILYVTSETRRLRAAWKAFYEAVEEV